MPSPYRFSDPNQDGTDMRSRVGLAGVSSGASSGGEGYRLSALRPGSGGYTAATFGAAPRTDYVKPAPKPTDTPATPEPTAAPTLAPAEAQAANGPSAEGAGPETGITDGGTPADLTDLGIDVDGKTVGGMLGGLAGGLALGPLGALAGGFIGRGIGGSLGSQNDGMASGTELAGLGDQAEQNAANMAGAGFGDARGLAQGGRVGPQNLHRGLAGVNMGGYAGGGHVAPLRRGAHETPTPRWNWDWETLEDEATQDPRNPPGPMNRLPRAKDLGAYAGGGSVGMPHYMDGGQVDDLAGPDPAGPDDGFAALDQGEFVVKQDQAQRPDYAPILDQINQGTYEPGAGGAEMGDEGESMMTAGTYPAEGAGGEGGAGSPESLPPMMQQALAAAMAADPMLQAALMTLLGPAGAHEIIEMGQGGDMADPNEMGEGDPMDGQNGRPPLAGPRPVPGMSVPPGVRPPPAANPTMPFPPPQQPPVGLRGVAA